MILGLDIGGANTKAASSDGLFAESVYLPLWKNAPLAEVLGRFAGQAAGGGGRHHGRAGGLLLMQAGGHREPDCQRSRRAFSCPVYFWGANGFGWTDPLELAAANWSASAALVAREVGDCLFVDMGSTTTDLIPIRGRSRRPRRPTFCAWPGASWSTWACFEPAWMLCCPWHESEGTGAACAGAVRHHRRCPSGSGPDRRWIATPARRRTGLERTGGLPCAGWRERSAPTWRRSARPGPWP